MFNFNTTITLGKNIYTIENNDFVGDQYKIGAVQANAIIEHWLTKVIIPQITKANPAKESFDNLVREVTYLNEALNKVKYLKSLNCSYRNKDRETLESRVRMEGDKFYDAISWDALSTPQMLVLKSLSERGTDLSTSDIQDLYNPVTDSTAKLDKWHKELMSFDYKKYGISKDSLLRGTTNRGYSYNVAPLSAYNSVLLKIEHFRAIINEAGDDLINWSNQKISLRLTKLGIKENAWEISDYVTKYNDHLTKKGVVREDKKVNTSKGKLESLVADGKPEQDDFFRYYKQASKYDATKILDKMDLEHLFMVIDSDLKCVKDKLFDKHGTPESDFKTIANLLCGNSVTKQDYKRIIQWAKPLNVSESFMIKHKDHASITEVSEYCITAPISSTDYINDEFYQTCLTKIGDKTKYTLNAGLTWQYMARMNESEKVKMLKRIVEDDSVKIGMGSLYGLYNDVNYNLIKDTIKSDNNVLNHLALKVVKENDHDTMVFCATNCARSLDTSKKQGIFNRLTFAEKKQVIKIDCDNGLGSFTVGLKKLNDKEIFDLMTMLINDNRSQSYIITIFKNLKASNNLKGIVEANKIVKGMDNPNTLPLSLDVIGCLSVDTKIDLLKRGIYLKDDTIYHSYNNTTPKVSDGLGLTFFSDMRREDIDKVYDSPVSSEYRIHIAHVMSKEELELCASSELRRWSTNTNAKDLQESFFRKNITLFSYGFLKRFKEKEDFRMVVGDRRDRSNKSFGDTLLKKLGVSNSVDFMFD